MKVNYQKFEEILKKINYPESKLIKFREVFAKTFFTKVGQKLEGKLNPEQHKKLLKISNEKDAKISNLTNYLETLRLNAEVKKIIDDALGEMLNYTLERMIKYASPKEAMIISQTLQI